MKDIHYNSPAVFALVSRPFRLRLLTHFRYESEHDSKCITVFSAPNYCDSTGNEGAYINIGPDYELKFNKFQAVEHPDIKPMAYASNSPLRSMSM